MTKTSLLVLSLAAFSLNAGTLEIGQESIHVPNRLAGASVSFDEGSFFVKQGAQISKVENYNLDTSLRDITSTKLTTFLDHGYLKLNQNSNDEFTLTSNLRMLGGGPLSGLIGYWATKALAYGTAAAAVGTAVVATGGAAGAATGALAAGATAGASTGATVVAGAIAGAGGAEAALAATSSTIAAAGGVAGAMAAVESGALGVGAFLTAIPFLP